MMEKTVLVVGGGGREHAIAFQLAQSGNVESVYVAPGNGGTDGDASGKIRNVPQLNVSDHVAVVRFCEEKKIALVVVGPEIPLVSGITDELNKAGFLCFGPSKLAARLEGSKAFSKDFMVRNNIDTAKHESFTEYEKAAAYVKAIKDKIVIKASGLAAGKGVILPETEQEALEALKTIMVDKKFGDEAGAEVVIEELLEGPEVSVFAFSDGHNVHVLPASQDHKRVFEGDKGPNTGGMGAYCPAPVFTKDLADKVLKDVVQRTVDAAREEGYPFKGLLYSGLMLTKNGPKVLEYNVRFGDPETEAVLLLLKSDLFDIMMACAQGDIRQAGEIKCDTDCSAVTVIAASEGYPGSYPKGKVITGIEQAHTIKGVKVFHAGTKKTESGQLVTSGGRVLAVSSKAPSLEKALEQSYQALSLIHFEGMQYRKDIAHRALKGKVLGLEIFNDYKVRLGVAAGIVALISIGLMRSR